jgi:hypothetical protein
MVNMMSTWQYGRPITITSAINYWRSGLGLEAENIGAKQSFLLVIQILIKSVTQIACVRNTQKEHYTLVDFGLERFILFVWFCEDPTIRFYLFVL